MARIVPTIWLWKCCFFSTPCATYLVLFAAGPDGSKISSRKGKSWPAASHGCDILKVAFIPGFAQAQLMRNPSSIVAMKLLVVGRCHSDDGDERTHVIARSCIRHKNVYQTVVDAQIGSASCRERVCPVRVDLGCRRIIKNKKKK